MSPLEALGQLGAALTYWKPFPAMSRPATTGKQWGSETVNQIMERSAVQARKFKRSCASAVTEKKLTDSYAEMPSFLSRLPVVPHAQRTVCSARGQCGPPAHTPAQGKLQKGNRSELGPFWLTLVKKVELTVRTPVLCRRRAAVMSIPVLCTTGKLAPGASALRTPPCQPSTQLQPGVGRLLALSACRREKSSACESMWAKWDPKSVLKAFGLKL